MRTLLAAIAVLALTGTASAYCVAAPEDAQSGYVANNMQRTFCIQKELNQAAEQRRRQVELDATLHRLQRDLQQQKFMLQQQQQKPFGQPAFP